MHRTQIYLHDPLHESLKLRARSLGVSLSELIRRTLETHLNKNPAVDARAFFDKLKPLQSFAEVDSVEYVSGLRSKSRLMRDVASAQPRKTSRRANSGVA